MAEYFATSEDKIQLVISLNFIGLAAASLIAGPLSDSYGRKNVMVFGVIVFTISCFGCLYASNYAILLFWRLLQGVGGGIMSSVTFPMVMDSCREDEASSILGIWNSAVSAALTLAPLIGSFIGANFGWRANFIVVLVLAIITSLATIIYLEESLPAEKRVPIRFKLLARNYVTILKNKNFVYQTIICVFPYIGMIVYIANSSLLFINHFGMSEERFGFYQTIITCTFMLISLFTGKIIRLLGEKKTYNYSIMVNALGAFILLVIAVFAPHSPNLITLAMIIYTAGLVLFWVLCGAYISRIFPHLRGTSSSILLGVRLVGIALCVSLSGVTFNGTIMPIAIIISALVVIALICYQKDSKLMQRAN
jgi:DHA1 family bicyclomycin/chloramphenicol resistance-like MFS transporter